ncbi:MAG TPA: AI-2E family transporter, partial [Rhodothermales bacterium]|nr:AI-2E family transporter [Rhodothermales bacterium]
MPAPPPAAPPVRPSRPAPPDSLAAARDAAVARGEASGTAAPAPPPGRGRMTAPGSRSRRPAPPSAAAPLRPMEPPRRARFGLRGVLGIVAALGALALLRTAGDLVLLTVLGAALAYLLQPLVDGLERRGMGRSAAAAAVFFGLLGVLAALTVALAPVAIQEASVLKAQWADGRLYRLLDDAERTLTARLPVLDYGTLGFADAARRALDSSGNELLGYVPDALSGLTDGIIVPFVLFFLLRDGPTIRRRAVALVPNRYFEFVMGVLYKSDAHLGGYLRSQALVAVFVGATTTLGLGLVGVSNYAVLGFLTGLLNFVP